MPTRNVPFPLPSRQLGRSPVRVPRLGIGTAPLGGFFGPMTDELAADVLISAQRWGAGFYDTAPVYDYGVTEERVGKALQKMPRQSYLISTKVGILVNTTERQRTIDFTRAGVLTSLESSRARLGIEQFDILHIHNPDLDLRTALDEAYPLLDQMRRDGEVGAVSIGVDHAEVVAEFIQHADLDCALIAGRHTLLEQGALPVLDACQKRGVSVLMAGVYNSGILAQGAIPGVRYNYRPAPPEILQRVARIQALCAKHGVSLRAAALQFPLAHPAAAGLVVGAMSAEEVRQTLQALFEPVPAQLWQDLKKEGLIREEAPTP